MNNRFTYSIVIPHYNAPTLLARMLSSIPERDDIQIIVVDDGSTNDAKEKISALVHKNLTIEYLPENHGGGYARNVGFSEVEGKWFIGCDADDFFSEGAFDVLDKYKDEKLDYLCYCIKVVDEKTLERRKTVRSDISVRRFLESKTIQTLNLFKYRNYEPWNKMISVQFMKNNHIHWENCRINIDVMFSLQVGLYGNNFIAIPDELYNLVFTENSITRKKKSIEREFNFYLQVQKRNSIYKALKLRYPFYRPDWMYLPFLLKKRGLKDTLAFYKYKRDHREEVVQARLAYLPLLQKGINNV